MKEKEDEKGREPYEAPTVALLEIQMEQPLMAGSTLQIGPASAYEDGFDDQGDFGAGGSAGTGGGSPTFSEMD
jgi:hypothetical protein